MAPVTDLDPRVVAAISDEPLHWHAALKRIARLAAECERERCAKVWPDDLEAGFYHAIEVALVHGASAELIAAMRAEWDDNTVWHPDVECFHCARMREIPAAIRGAKP